jgi:hypothetical protein
VSKTQYGRWFRAEFKSDGTRVFCCKVSDKGLVYYMVAQSADCGRWESRGTFDFERMSEPKAIKELASRRDRAGRLEWLEPSRATQLDRAAGWA